MSQLDSIRTRQSQTSHLLLAITLLGFGALNISDVLAQDPFDVNGFVGLYADPEGTNPCINVPPGEVGQIYLVVTNQGATAEGFAGLEFRLEVSNPEGYFFTYSAPGHAVIVLGNPFDLTPDDNSNPVGLNIAFGDCQTLTGNAGDRISLGSIQVVNLDGGGPTSLSVKRRTPPSNPNQFFPLFNACDSPMFTAHTMSACTAGPTGEVITSVAYLNDPMCDSSVLCTDSCAEPPGLRLEARRTPDVACPGETVLVEAWAWNTGSTNESIAFFVDGMEDLSFENVAPGDSVAVSRSVVFEDCSIGFSYLIGAVASTSSCSLSVGREVRAAAQCSTRECDDGTEGCARVVMNAPWRIRAGEEFSVGIQVGEGVFRARNLFGITGRLRFTRPDLLEFVEFTCTNEDGTPMDLGDEAICFSYADNVSGYVDFTVTQKFGTPGRFGDVSVARAVFKFVEDVGGGFCSQLRLEDVRLVDPGGRVLCMEDRFRHSTGICSTSPCEVWPGDTNRDGIVNALDIETLASFWGTEGPARFEHRGCHWDAEAVDCWQESDAAWSDAFGDGRVGAEDILCIGMNWGRINPDSRNPIQRGPLDHAKQQDAYKQMLAYMENVTDTDEGIGAVRVALDKLTQEMQIPSRTSLRQNVPNPFNPNTRIDFTLATSGHARIDVFDVMGRRVRTLLDKDLAAAEHFVTWDGTNHAGEAVSSGIYYYRAQLGTESYSRKMVLAR